MKTKFTLALAALMLSAFSFAQTVLWSEDFGTPASGTLAAGFDNGNGAWSVTSTGFNGTNPNIWYVSGEECGNAASTCGSVCTGGDASLHLGPPALVGDLGAAYAAGGTMGLTVETDLRVESPVIDLSGQSGMTLNFNYLEDIVGQAGFDAGDDATLWYFDGVVWSQLDPLVITPAGCDPQGTWTAFSIALPASADNNANVQIGFHWINNDDNIGTDPSFAVDDIEITTAAVTAPTSSFTPSATSICVGECLTFVDNSTGTITTWDWTFNGADTPTANTQDPGSICWSTAGTFDVDLQVSDGANVDVSTVSITVNAAPNVAATASPDATICAGDQLTLSGSGAATYAWDNGVTDGVAFTPTVSTTYTVTGTDANMCTRNFSIDIIVENCDSLVADYFIPTNNICVGQCIEISDMSSGNITDWSWNFGGAATPNTSTDQNPTVCFDSPGTFNIQLTLTDNLGANASTTQSVSVFASPSVNAQLDTIIDLGGEAALIANGSVPGTYSWFPSSNVDCDTCSITFASPWVTTTYTVTLSDINGCAATDTVKVYVNFIEGLGVPTAFSPNADGQNDVLYVKGIGITAMNFKIYNRYGEMVFETFEQMIGWDGTFRGKDENSGVFTWVLEYNMVNGNAGILKGNTTLIR
jgi:gliding motility-associated-like protein